MLHHVRAPYRISILPIAMPLFPSHHTHPISPTVTGCISSYWSHFTLLLLRAAYFVGSIPCAFMFFTGRTPCRPGCALCYRLHSISSYWSHFTLLLLRAAYFVGSIPCAFMFFTGRTPCRPGCALCYRLHTLSGQRPCATVFLRMGAYVLAAFPTGGTSLQTNGILTGGINLTYCPMHPLTGRYCLLKQYSTAR